MILIVAGVAGSGKTTVGVLISGKLGWEFTDGDDFHSPANIAKMRSGRPLTDGDRSPWLAAIGAWMDAQIAQGKPAVVACSALARRHRDALLRGRPDARIAFLVVSRKEAFRRLHSRHGHFFGERMVSSQFAELEPPEPDEKAVVAIAADKTPAELADDIISQLNLS